MKIASFLKSFFASRSNRILIYVILVDTLLIALLILIPGTLKNIIYDEGYKTLWQAALVTIGGGFISFAFAELKREQESREASREYFKTVSAKAVAEYNKAKKCRRLLRAKAIYIEDNEEYLRLDEYVKIMTELQDCQLEFESLSKEMMQAEDDLKIPLKTRNHLKLLETFFDKMEKYLNKILSEFEEKNHFKETKVRLSDKNYEKLKEFTQSLKTNKEEDKEETIKNFKTDFNKPFDDVLKTLIEEISK